MRFFVMLLVSTFSVIALAEYNVKNCIKGFNQKEQNQNLSLCEKQLTGNQACSDKMFEHGNGAYDVCVIELSNPQLQSCTAGYKQSEQNLNLANCLKSRPTGSICVANMFVHQQGAYFVCLMK